MIQMCEKRPCILMMHLFIYGIKNITLMGNMSTRHVKIIKTCLLMIKIIPKTDLVIEIIEKKLSEIRLS